jgi:hypothetical protein
MSIVKNSEGKYLVGVKISDKELMAEIIKMTHTKDAKSAGMYYDDKHWYLTKYLPINKSKN